MNESQHSGNSNGLWPLHSPVHFRHRILGSSVVYPADLRTDSPLEGQASTRQKPLTKKLNRDPSRLPRHIPNTSTKKSRSTFTDKTETGREKDLFLRYRNDPILNRMRKMTSRTTLRSNRDAEEVRFSKEPRNTKFFFISETRKIGSVIRISKSIWKMTSSIKRCLSVEEMLVIVSARFRISAILRLGMMSPIFVQK